MKRVLASVLAVFLMLSVGGSSSTARAAGAPRLEKKLSTDSTIFKMKIDSKVKPTAGKNFDVTIHVTPAPHWHVWASSMSADGGLVPLTLKVPDQLSKYFQIVKIRETGKLTQSFDSNFMTMMKAHYGAYDIIATVKVLANSQEKLPFFLYLNYQTCNESNCLPPRTFDVPMSVIGDKPLDIQIAEGTPDTAAARLALTDSSAMKQDTSHASIVAPITGGIVPPPASTSTQTIQSEANVVDIAQTSIWRFILAAAGFGMLALLTPCVFPMVPITVSFFTKRNAGSKKEAAKDAMLYAGGIIVTFVALGFVLSLVAGPAGINKFAANPWANLVIAGIFIAFALNLFGLFEIGVPSSILSKLNNTAQKSKNRAVSVLLMGFVFSLTSFTCTVPFVGTLMVAFSRGSWFVPLIGMVVFAMVFALPFFLLALFPSLMKSLPRSGGWLNNVKVVMGFLEIAAALKFFSNADLIWSWHFFSRDLVLAAWVAIAIITTFYLLGRFQLSHDTPVDNLGAMRVIIAVIFLSGGIFLYTGFHGRPLGQLDAFLPPAEAEAGMITLASNGLGGSSPNAQQAAEWYDSYTTALAEAKRTHKNVFIDFTGYTCTNCRAMESTVFSREDVKQMFGSFVLARLYTDNGTPLNDSNRTMEESRFNTIALPYYVIISPDDKPLATFPGFTRDAEAFKSFLKLQRSSSETNVAMLNR